MHALLSLAVGMVHFLSCVARRVKLCGLEQLPFSRKAANLHFLYTFLSLFVPQTER